jgi:hypothetical protein
MADPIVLYDWANPQQQIFARLTKMLRKQMDLDKRFRAYHARFYGEGAFQRRNVRAEIDAALTRGCTGPFVFTNWQRTIRFQWSDHPLCTVGSLITGGRFNIGNDIDPATFPPFSALYAASDRETSLRETFGQEALGTKMDAREYALADSKSIAIFSVSGQLDHVLDLRTVDAVRDFVAVIKNFKVPHSLMMEAKKLPVAPPRFLRTPKQLIDSLLNKNWRHVKTLCEVPSNSQTFGQIVAQAKIEGILYQSTQGDGDCLAIFPQNFIGGSSVVALDDPVPGSQIGPTRIDATNWEACERPAAELAKSPLRRSVP